MMKLMKHETLIVGLPFGYVKIAMEMAIEIVDFPIENGFLLQLS